MKCSLLLLLLPLFAFAGKDGEKAEKKISREFNIQTDGHVDLFNKYGNIDIAIGKSDQVKIDVVITVEASSVKKAQESLDRISVEFEEGNNRVQATTEIESTSGWLSWFNTGNIQMDINYQVLVPADVYLDLCNKYGNIYVETTNRDIGIELAYGNIRLGDINGNLKLDMSYSEGSISLIKDGDLTLSYSDLEMEDGHDVDMDIKYTEIKAGSLHKVRMESGYSNLHSIAIDELDYNGKYDDLVIDRVGSMNAESGYTGIVIDEMERAGDFDMRYGDLKVHNIHRGFSSIHVNSSYTGVNLQFRPDAMFSVDAETTYCDIHHDNLKISEDTQRQTSSTLRGSRGTGGGEVVVRMNYGELSID